MYYIYVDEAGTSAREPVTVVVGVIINADTHWQLAFQELQTILDANVPPQLRPGFIFHAKDIWSSYREHTSWERKQRLELIAAVAAIPRRLQMAVSLGRAKRTLKGEIEGLKMKPQDFDHLMAFGGCIRRANKYVREWGNAAEVATLVAEDVHDKRRQLRAMLKAEMPQLNESHFRPTIKEIISGQIKVNNAGPIDRIVDTVHFAAKTEAPLLQIADACAFSFRRYFSEQDYGEDLVKSMLGTSLIRGDWQGPFSEMSFNFNPRRRISPTSGVRLFPLP